MLKVTNVSKRYGNTLAVNDISFGIEKGHICGFVGPNGAGKSTTMNMITGYLPVSSGTISIDGMEAGEDLIAYRRRFGYLPELPPLYMDMTVGEYLNFVHEAKGLPKESRKQDVDLVLEMTQTGHVQGRLIKNLSKGYKQRVGMAQAFLGQPPLIILDEPTIGLDPSQIVQVRNILLSLKENHTVLLSSHILSEISEVCDEIVLINRGRIIAQGKEEDIIRQHLTERCYLLKTDEPLSEEQIDTIRSISGVNAVESGSAGELESVFMKLVEEANADEAQHTEEKEELS